MASRVPEENSSSIVWTSEPFTAGRSTVGPNTVARFCSDILFSDSFSATLCTDQQTNTTTFHLTAVSFQVNLGQAVPPWVLLYLFGNKTCGLVELAFFYRTDALPVTQPLVWDHQREHKTLTLTSCLASPFLILNHTHDRRRVVPFTPAHWPHHHSSKHVTRNTHKTQYIWLGPPQQLDKVGNAHLSVGVVDIRPRLWFGRYARLAADNKTPCWQHHPYLFLSDVTVMFSSTIAYLGRNTYFCPRICYQ